VNLVDRDALIHVMQHLVVHVGIDIPLVPEHS